METYSKTTRFNGLYSVSNIHYQMMHIFLDFAYSLSKLFFRLWLASMKISTKSIEIPFTKRVTFIVGLYIQLEALGEYKKDIYKTLKIDKNLIQIKRLYLWAGYKNQSISNLCSRG